MIFKLSILFNYIEHLPSCSITSTAFFYNLKIKYYNRPICIKKFISNNLLPRYKKVYFWFSQKNRLENVIFNLKIFIFLLSNLSNLVSFILYFNIEVFYNNKNKIFYNINTKNMLI